MELTSILSLAITSLIVLVLSHVAVFWVVRTLYPPAPNVTPIYITTPPPNQITSPVFTEPPREIHESVNVPTYETPLQLEAANQEGSTKLDFLSSAPTNGSTGMVAAHA